MEEVDEMINKRIETLSSWELSRFRSWMQDFNMGIIGKTELTRHLTRLLKLEDHNLDDPKNDPKIRIKVDENTKALRKIDLEKKRKGSTEGKEKLVELLTAIEKRLSPSEKRSYNSLCKDFKFGKSKLNKFMRSLLPLIKKYKDLYQGFREIVYGDQESQEDEVEESQDDQDMDIEENLISEPKIGTGLKIQERESLNVVDKKKRGILLRKDSNNKESQEDEVEETRDDQDMDIEENLSELKIGTGLKIQERESLNVVDDKKEKRGILFRKDSNNQTDERPTKKQKTSKRYERVTPNYYRLIPEEEQSSPVSSTVLNNSCMLRKVVTEGGKELTDIEEEMNECEDQMYETDMVVEALESAVDRANKVMRGEIGLDDLGVKFYRCVEQMYGGDMFELVREDHQRALPVILKRLNQKLLEVKATRESFKPVWKQAIEETYAKQRASIAQDHKEKLRKQ